MKNLVIFITTIITAAAAENSAISEFTTANNLFAGSVYKQLTLVKDGNFLVSPFSAETVLAFALSGARGKTAEELRLGLHFPNDTDKMESAIKSLLPKFKENKLYTLHTANKMYLKTDFQIKDEFKRAASLVFHADAENVDFTQNEKAATTMNSWVEKHTNNKIKDLINSQDLNNFTRAVLINALYFKANWSKPFLLASTSKDTFYKTDKDFVEVDFLRNDEGDFKYHESKDLDAKFLELPFQGEEASLVVVLPNKKDGLAAVEKQIGTVFEQQSQLSSQQVNVVIPKFKIESSIDFKEVMENLGVKLAFEEKIADLSGISGNPGDLFIAKAAQKTFIDVNEEGVEAAAATYVIVAVPESISYPRPLKFVADHPFIFYLKVKDLVLFVGRVTDPSIHQM